MKNKQLFLVLSVVCLACVTVILVNLFLNKSKEDNSLRKDISITVKYENGDEPLSKMYISEYIENEKVFRGSVNSADTILNMDDGSSFGVVYRGTLILRKNDGLRLIE